MKKLQRNCKLHAILSKHYTNNFAVKEGAKDINKLRCKTYYKYNLSSRNKKITFVLDFDKKLIFKEC